MRQSPTYPITYTIDIPAALRLPEVAIIAKYRHGVSTAQGRVACVISFRVARDQRRVLFMPQAFLAELEREFAQNEYALIQIFIDLGQAHSSAAVDELRRRGYSQGGFLPTWF